jgi:hypothetical protein
MNALLTVRLVSDADGLFSSLDPATPAAAAGELFKTGAGRAQGSQELANQHLPWG